MEGIKVLKIQERMGFVKIMSRVGEGSGMEEAQGLLRSLTLAPALRRCQPGVPNPKRLKP